MSTIEILTQQILTHHLTAFGSNDLDEIMKDYSEESEVLTTAGNYCNQRIFKEFFIAIPTGSVFEMKQMTVTGNAAYIVWESESPIVKIPVGTDTFFIEGEKIRFHTVADYRLPK